MYGISFYTDLLPDPQVIKSVGEGNKLGYIQLLSPNVGAVPAGHYGLGDGLLPQLSKAGGKGIHQGLAPLFEGGLYRVL